MLSQADKLFSLSGTVLLGLIPLLALLLYPIRSTPIGSFLKQRRPAKQPALLTLTVGELTVILAYLVCHLLLMFHWYTVHISGGVSVQRALTLSTGTGGLTNIMMISLPVTKKSLWMPLLGVPFERTIKFHKLLGWFTILVLSVHFAFSTTFASPLSWQKDETSGDVVTIYGLAAYICFFVVVLSGLDFVRRKSFEAFKIAHFAFIPGTILIFFHLPWMLALIYLAIPLSLYAIDVILRRVKSAKGYVARPLQAMKGGVTKLEVDVNGSTGYNAGSYYFLRIPAISVTEYHPVSVCGTSNRRTLTFMIKSMGEGRWSGKLFDLAIQGSKVDVQPTVHLDGPYGNLSIDLDGYTSLLLVAGGIGITPMTSIIKTVEGMKEEGKLQRLARVDVVWVIRTGAEMTWFDSFLTSLTNFPMAALVESEGKREGTAAKANVGVQYNIKLFVTQAEKVGEAMEVGIPFQRGRPDLSTVVKAFHLENGGKGAAVVVCGPKRMTKDVKNASIECKLPLHEEIFTW